ncbi:hypothetical protein [Elizabethkingia miricola]|uniref:Uncharacterized protein n=1 Tax=Elizabethkingia miricola TaxID=172045 RepID=A0ABD5B2V3_ELIMR|nr:hypothetical protein [Elizabethkingia miricola]MDQ8747736.1 hypothetical protein [Elizabethkingia miricola]
MDSYIKFINDIKKNKSFPEILKDLEDLVKKDFIFKEILNNGLFIKSYADLHINSPLPNSKIIEGEISFIVFTLLQYSEKINKFLIFEDEFEYNLILGNYVKCDNILEKIEYEIGVSDWLTENRFGITQKLRGSEGNWELLKELNTKAQNNYAQFFNYVYSKKAEPETSVHHFYKEIEVITNGLDIATKDYVSLKFNNSNYNYTDYAGILNLESTATLIDKYITTLKVLNELSSQQSYQQLVKKIVNELNEKIKDKRLLRFTEVNYYFNKKINDFNKNILNIYNHYSYGGYENTLKTSINYISLQPCEFSIYEIIVKSLLVLKKDIFKTEISENIDYILENLYYLLKRDSDFYTYKENLLKLFSIFSNLKFFNQLESYIQSITQNSIKTETAKKYFINSKYTNPQVILFNFQNKNKNFPQNIINNNISVKINLLIFQNKLDELEKLNIPPEKKMLYKIRSKIFNDKIIENDVNSIYKLLEDYNLDNNSIEELIYYCYKLLIEHNKLSQITDLIVKYYFLNNHLIERIQIGTITEMVVQDNYDIEYTNINLPILFNIGGSDFYYQYSALDQFLTFEKVELPSQLKIEKYERNKIIYLLEEICNIEVLTNFYLIFNNEEEIIHERVKILEILKNINIEKFEKYDDEINFINYRHKIKKTLRNVNDGKIILNSLSFSEETSKSYEAIYNRLIRLNDFTLKNELSFFDINELAGKYLDEIKNNKTLLNQASFVSFKSLLFDILEDYLFSKKYGLDFILSTRFRHGVIENHIRSVFTNNHLISVKNKDDIYKDIDYWNHYELNGVDNLIINKLQTILKEFSSKIDDYINFIVKEYIQIFTNRFQDKKYALFNYSFTNEYLWLIYKDSLGFNLTYKNFIDTLNDIILKKHTQKLLQSTGDFFIYQINVEFQNLIENLENEIKDSFNYKNLEIFKDLSKSLNNSKTFIEKELHEIARWFKINNTTDSTLEGATIINVSIDSYPYQIPYEIEDTLTVAFDGAYFYIDIIRILVDNALKYSNLDPDKMKLKFYLSNSNIKYLDSGKKEFERTAVEIKIENNFSLDEVEYKEMILRLNEVKNKWNKDLNLVNVEGGSGFQKIEKILKYDLKVFNSNMDYKIDSSKIIVKIQYEI